MRTFIYRVLQVAVLPPILVAGAGCGGGGGAPPARTPELTSAPASAAMSELNDAKEKIAQLQRERDEAHRLAQDEKSRLEQVTKAHQERADFEKKERDKLDAIDRELRPLLEKAGRASPAQRGRVEELSKKREQVDKLVRRALSEPEDRWAQYKSEVDMEIDDLRKSVESTRIP